MNLHITLTRALSPGVWLAKADPKDLALFGPALLHHGRRNVLLVLGASISSDGRNLVVTPSRCHLGCNSTGEETVVVDIAITSGEPPVEGEADVESQNSLTSAISGMTCPPPVSHALPFAGSPPAMGGVTQCGSALVGSTPAENPAERRSPRDGDEQFVESLRLMNDASLTSVGERILAGVREHYPRGRLVYYPASRRYIQSPDNFWTIKVQTRDKSLAITVRGKETHFRSHIIRVLRDRGSYSRFKVSSTATDEVVAEAVRLILSARRRH